MKSSHIILYNNNTQDPAPSYVLNDIAPNCHTKLVISLYFKEEK